VLISSIANLALMLTYLTCNYLIWINIQAYQSHTMGVNWPTVCSQR